MIDLSDLASAEPAPSTAVGERVLVAAAELFYRQGITRVGVDLIAAEAGVTKRTLYQRFGSKDGLIATYLDRRRHRWQAGLLAVLAASPPTDGGSALRTVFDAARAWASENPRGCAFVNAWAELAPRTDHPASVIIAGEKRWMRELWGRLLGDDELARAVHQLYEGAQVLHTILGEQDAFDHAERAARRLLDET